MKDELRKIFENSPAIDKDGLKNFFMLLDAKDEEFDTIYPLIESEIDSIFEGEEYQNEIKNKMKLMPKFEIEQEIENVNTILKEIDSDDSLSDNKKKLLHKMFESSLKTVTTISDSGRAAIPVKVFRLNSNAKLPEYAHPTDAGADIFASEETTINSGETKLIKTGLAIAVPAGYEVQIRPRSGLSLKTGLRIANSVGTIDSSYRGEVCVIITNTGSEPYTIKVNDKIAQMLIAPTPMISWREVYLESELGSTERGTGGFGSTDTKS